MKVDVVHINSNIGQPINQKARHKDGLFMLRISITSTEIYCPSFHCTCAVGNFTNVLPNLPHRMIIGIRHIQTQAVRHNRRRAVEPGQYTTAISIS